jgi:hypothetical protein
MVSFVQVDMGFLILLEIKRLRKQLKKLDPEDDDERIELQ